MRKFRFGPITERKPIRNVLAALLCCLLLAGSVLTFAAPAARLPGAGSPVHARKALAYKTAARPSPLPAAATRAAARPGVTPDLNRTYRTRPLIPLGSTYIPESLQKDPAVLVDESSLGGAWIQPQIANDSPSSSSLSATDPLITPQIAAAAASLGNDPLRIFAYVRNEFEYEPYYFGMVKGSQETLDAKAGNDVDLASLLIAMLRSGGTPARYVRRTIKVPGDTAPSWVGVRDPLTAARILATGGKKVTVATRQGAVSSLVFDHTWVEANVPEGGGKAWKALDPSFKLHTLQSGRNVVKEALAGTPLYDALMPSISGDFAKGEIHTIDMRRVRQTLEDRKAQVI